MGKREIDISLSNTIGGTKFGECAPVVLKTGHGWNPERKQTNGWGNHYQMLNLQVAEAVQIRLKEVSQIGETGLSFGPMGWSSRIRLPNFQTAAYNRYHVRPKWRIAKDCCGSTVLVPTARWLEIEPLFWVLAFQKKTTLANTEIKSVTKSDASAPGTQLLIGRFERQNVTRCFNKEKRSFF